MYEAITIVVAFLFVILIMLSIRNSDRFDEDEEIDGVTIKDLLKRIGW